MTAQVTTLDKLARQRQQETAKAAAIQAVENLMHEQRLLRTWREGHPEIPAYVDMALRNAELDIEEAVRMWRLAAR